MPVSWLRLVDDTIGVRCRLARTSGSAASMSDRVVRWSVVMNRKFRFRRCRPTCPKGFLWERRFLLTHHVMLPGNRPQFHLGLYRHPANHYAVFRPTHLSK